MVIEVKLDPVALANELRPLLLRLARELRRETGQLGVTPRQATLLALIERQVGITASELAAEEAVSLPVISNHLDRLERAGLLHRSRSAADRRRFGLTLSSQGQALLRRIRAHRTAVLAERLGRLHPAELEQIAGVLPVLRRLGGVDA
jgi:DNA-binding MarR family transcriptional regulator